MKDSATAFSSDQAYSSDAETPLAYRVVRGGLWVAASSYWTIGFGFVATIVLTRLLSPEAFGQFAYAMFFAQLLSLSPKLGLSYAFVQHKDTTDETMGTYVVMEFLAALGSLVLTLLAAPILPSSVFLICLVYAAAAVAGIGGIGGLLLEKELRLGRTSLIQSIVIPVSYIPALLLAVRGGGAWSLVAQVVTHSLLYSAVIVWTMRQQLPQIWRARRQFNPVLARRFLGFGLTVGLSLFVGGLLTSLDNFFIGTFVGVTALGFYDRAYRTAQWPSTLLVNMSARTSLYTYARLQDDVARLQKAVTMMLWLIALFAMPIALLIFVTAPDLLVLLYGERWLPSVPFLRLLVFISAVRPLWENASTFLVATGKPRLSLTFMVIQVLVLVAAGLPMTVAWGAVGTCVAVGLAFGVGMVGFYRAVARKVPINLSEVFGAPVAVSILTLLSYLAFNRWTYINDWAVPIRVAIKSLFAVSVYLGFTFLLQPRIMRERLVYIFKLIKGGG